MTFTVPTELAGLFTPPKRLPDAQHTRLMRFHLGGDFGPGKPATYVTLVSGGYVAEMDRKPTLTAKGLDYCRYHAVN